MADPKKRPRRLQLERDLPSSSVPPRPGDLAPGEAYRRSMLAAQARLDRDYPWRQSYVNWCTHVGRSAAQHNAVIAFGADTYAAWESGISPCDYAAARSRE